MKAARAPELWYRDAAARRFFLRGYLPWLLAFSTAWEIAQLPLYALWREGSPGYLAFAVAHCTAGDILIGAAALVLALLLERAGALARWRWPRIVLWSTGAALAYTVSSEWMNTLLGRWAYSPLMPALTLGAGSLGLSPLAQWLVLQPLALYAARNSLLR